MGNHVCERILTIVVGVQLHPTLLSILALQVPVVRDALQRDGTGIAIRSRHLDDRVGVGPVAQIERRNDLEPELREGAEERGEFQEEPGEDVRPGYKFVALRQLLETAGAHVVHVETNADHRVGFFVALVTLVDNSANLLIAIRYDVVRPANAELERLA